MSSFFRLNDETDISAAGPIIKKDDFVAWIESEALLKEAHAKADRIVADAKAAFEEERRRGFQEGIEAGLKVADENNKKQSDELSEAYASELAQVHAQVPLLICEAVKKICGELSEDDLLKKVVTETLKHPTLKGNVVLHANPADFDALMDGFDSLVSENQDLEEIEILKDKGIPPGSFKVTSEASIIQTSPKEQMDSLASLITDGAFIGEQSGDLT